MRGHQDSVHSAELLMFSNIILSSSVDKTLMLWDARTVIEINLTKFILIHQSTV